MTNEILSGVWLYWFAKECIGVQLLFGKVSKNGSHLHVIIEPSGTINDDLEPWKFPLYMSPIDYKRTPIALAEALENVLQHYYLSDDFFMDYQAPSKLEMLLKEEINIYFAGSN